MATSTQQQPYQAGHQYSAPSTQGGQAGGPQGGYSTTVGPPQSAHGHYGPLQTGHQFDKFCIAHIATTCDEHGVYVTKDSAEVIEIGWVVVDARDPGLKEVRSSSLFPLLPHTSPRFHDKRNYVAKNAFFSSTTKASL